MAAEASTLFEGDCRDVMELALAENSVDSIVTDPPYHLTTGKKGGSGEASVNLDSPYGRARVTTGFMGMKWDGGDVAMRPETWRAALAVLKPGGYLLAFSGTRTYHRMVCAIEDAGFEIRDQIQWIYGSGFPKSHNGEWGGTALKPAHEPIVVARKPLIGTVEANFREWGTGGLNIDGCRVEPTGESRERAGEESQDRRYTDKGATDFAAKPGVRGGDPFGRWPANIIHDGSDEVVGCFPNAPGQLRAVGPEHGEKPSVNVFGDMGARPYTPPRGDSGNAARFFYCAKASKADRNAGCEALPDKLFGMSSAAAAAAARGEHYDNGDGGVNKTTLRKNNHPTVKPTDLMRYLCRLVTPPGGTVLDPFMGSGSTGRGAALEGFQFIGIEQDPAYLEIARARIEEAQRGS